MKKALSLILCGFLGVAFCSLILSSCVTTPKPETPAQEDDDNTLESGDSKTDDERERENALIRMRRDGHISFNPNQHPNIYDKKIGQGQYLSVTEFIDKRVDAPGKHVGTLYNLMYHAPVTKLYNTEPINLTLKNAMASLLAANGFDLQEKQKTTESPIIVEGTINKFWVGLHHSIYGEIDIDVKIVDSKDSKVLWSGKMVKAKDIDAPKGAGYGVMFGVMGDGTELEPFLNGLFAEAIVEAWETGGLKNALKNISTEMAKEGQNKQTLIELSDKNPSDFDAKGCLKIGIQCYELGSFQNAIKYLERAVDLEPKWGRARYALGLAYLKAGDKESAISQYEGLKSLDENYARKLFDDIHR